RLATRPTRPPPHFGGSRRTGAPAPGRCATIANAMDSFSHKRDRLLRRTARVIAGAALATSFAVASTPETGGTIAYWVALPFYLAAGLFIARFHSSRPLVILVCASLAELIIAFCLVSLPEAPDASATLAVMTL